MNLQRFKGRLPKYIEKAIKQYGYDVREYQVEATIKAITRLNSGENVGICLPPGTGKTLISQMVATMWLNRRNSANNRVLIVVPNTNLLQQHSEMSDWAHQARLWDSLQINGEWRSKRRCIHDTDLKGSRVWFSLCKQFSQAVQKDDISLWFLNTITLIIVDEYDSFSKSILDDESRHTLNFKKDMLALQRALRGAMRSFVFMSATPPRDYGSKQSIWSNSYSPMTINIPKQSYIQYIPIARVTPIGIEDSLVFMMDQQIRSAITTRFIIVQKEVFLNTGLYISIKYLFQRIDAILRYKRIRLPKRPALALSKNSVTACRELKSLKFYRLCIFEDLGSYGSTDIKQLYFDSKRTSKLQYETRAKFNVLRTLLTREIEKSHSVVVFIRYVNTVLGTSKALEASGIKNSYVFGEQDPEERKVILQKFRRGDIRVLLASRELFGRGFDLPEADAAIFYSPKDNVRTIWQEFLRIRATNNVPKHIYLLFYLWTAETFKIERLLRSMWERGANRMRGKYWWRYKWDFTEKDREESSQPEDFAYFDWSFQGGATFKGGIGNSYRRSDDEYYNYEYSAYEGTETGEGKNGKIKKLPVKDFVKEFLKALRTNIDPWNAEPFLWFNETANSCGLLNQYKQDSIQYLIKCLINIVTNKSWEKASTAKIRRWIILKGVHPDQHQRQPRDTLSLHTEITRCLLEVM